MKKNKLLENIFFYLKKKIKILLILIDQQGPQKRVGPCWCGEINGWNGGGKATNKKNDWLFIIYN